MNTKTMKVSTVIVAIAMSIAIVLLFMATITGCGDPPRDSFPVVLDSTSTVQDTLHALRVEVDYLCHAADTTSNTDSYVFNSCEVGIDSLRRYERSMSNIEPGMSIQKQYLFDNVVYPGVI